MRKELNILKFVVLVCSFTLSAYAIGTPKFVITKAMQKAANIIDENPIRADVKFLSSDLLEGRGPATRGDALSQEYIASRLQSMGIMPGAADGSWFQKVPLVGVTSHPPVKLDFVAGQQKLSLKYHDDYMVVSGTLKETTKLKDAEIVFVGYGIVAPEYDWNDFKDVDVKGKVILVMNNDPSDDPKLFEGERRLYYGRWNYKYEQAARMGALGAIIIHTTPSAAYPWQVVQTSWSGESFRLPSEDASEIEFQGWATEESSRQIARLGGHDLDELRKKAESREFRPVSLGVRFDLEMKNFIQQKVSRNVIGKINGNDEALAKQSVIYTAHHDHLGMKSDSKPGEDAIYNGALDNASGVSVVLSVAKAFQEMRSSLQRSVYFVFVAAEEQGLLGSEYFAKNPPMQPGRIAANINVDGASIFGKTKDISFIGLGKSDLDDKVKFVATSQRRVVKGDENPGAGGFYRSDQFNFAKIGVPAAYLRSGTEVIGKPAGFGKKQLDEFIKNHYHQPSDKYHEDWDLTGAVEDAQLLFYVGALVANTKEMPIWKKGDEFEAARIKALENLSKGN